MDVSWSGDDDSEGEVESESAKHVTVLTGRVLSDTNSCDKVLSYEDLAFSFNELVARNSDMCQLVEKQEKTISHLQAEKRDHLAKISEINDEVIQLNSQLEHVKKQVRMMTTSTNVLEEILEGQSKENPKVTAFDYKTLNKKQRNMSSAYAPKDCGIVRKQQLGPDVTTDDSSTSKSMLQHSKEHQNSKNRKSHCAWTCHYCKGRGHIKPFCFKLYDHYK